MSSDQRTSTVFMSLRPAHVAAVALSMTLAACSADVTRFDGPSFNLTGDKTTGPAAAHPRSGLTGEGSEGVPPPSNRVASLPPPSGPGYAAQPLPPPREVPADRAAAAPRAKPAASGETVEVHAGDTISGIARRHHVTVAALSEVNNLGSNATIKAGQKLVLPQGAHSAPSTPAETPRAAPAKLPVAKAARPAEPAATANWDGKHTLRAGESVYAIARQYKTTAAELQRMNDISDPARVRVGTVLKVPTGQPGAVPLQEADPAAARTARAPAPTANEPATPAGITPGVRMLNQPERKAALSDRANDAEPAPAAEPVLSNAVHFPWPARGKVIGTFGKRPDGANSEGIKIQVPMGTDVRAVDGGKVIYASSEMQTYGNLVLIQHENGWVSAYGHADRLLVQPEDTVRKGQVIAKSGRTGIADQPQLHFELRQGSRPMDPLAYLDK
jgi:murein DD-endopeptidase MepM/ murein hydrolase activator NlpD